jgi:uncharacterized spore protein YtfJ
MLPQRINTIAELQAAQARLKDNMRVTRQAFFKSAGRTSVSGQQFLLKNILLPVSAVGLGVFAGSKISEYVQSRRQGSEKKQVASVGPEGNSSGWFPKFMLVAMPFLQQYLLSQQTDVEDEHKAQQSGVQENGPVAWLSKLAPIVIPLLQHHFLLKAEQAEEQQFAAATEDAGARGESHQGSKSDSTIFESLYKLVPVVLPLVQQFFIKENAVTEDNQGQSPRSNSRNGRYTEAVA